MTTTYVVGVVLYFDVGAGDGGALVGVQLHPLFLPPLSSLPTTPQLADPFYDAKLPNESQQFTPMHVRWRTWAARH